MQSECFLHTRRIGVSAVSTVSSVFTVSAVSPVYTKVGDLAFCHYFAALCKKKVNNYYSKGSLPTNTPVLENLLPFSMRRVVGYGTAAFAIR